MNTVALVTGANQGLGFALVKGLCDMSEALSPDDAAKDVLWLATLPAGKTSPQGELVQFRSILP